MIKFDKKYFPRVDFIFALSGGADSIAACHFLKQKKFNFFAVHVNNKFIPQDDEAEGRVMEFCHKEKIDLITETVSAKYSGGSKEDFCRKTRYEKLMKVAKQSNVAHVCTAHHLDDCIESYFLNFLKGCAEYAPIPYLCQYPDATIFRPFLLNKKSDLLQYAEHHKLFKYITEDELNNDLTLMRNWSRMIILPMIEKKYKGLSKVVFKKVKKHLDEVVKW